MVTFMFTVINYQSQVSFNWILGTKVGTAESHYCPLESKSKNVCMV